MVKQRFNYVADNKNNSARIREMKRTKKEEENGEYQASTGRMEKPSL